MAQVQGPVANTDVVSDRPRAADAVSLLRLYILRACYAILAAAEGSIQLGAFLHHDRWTLSSGINHSFLLALALLSIVGIRYPLRMLPLLIYELLWKVVWLCGIALPLWLANQLDAETRQAFSEIAPVIILVPLFPWKHIYTNFVQQAGDRWR